jgi:hypothetical protein
MLPNNRELLQQNKTNLISMRSELNQDFILFFSFLFFLISVSFLNQLKHAFFYRFLHYDQEKVCQHCQLLYILIEYICVCRPTNSG